MKNVLWLSLLLVAGCAAPTRAIKFDSNPQGAEVFLQSTISGEMARWPNLYPWDPIGKTPFTWTVPAEEDLGQRLFKAEVLIGGATREKRETVDLSSVHPRETNAIFFDLTAR